MTVGFVENSLKFSNISGEGIYILLNTKKAVLYFLDLIRIIVDARKLVKDRVVVVGAGRLSVYEL